MFLNASKIIFKNAAELRKNMTLSEQILWEYLRTKPLGHKFRRQHPISSYVADFYCHSLQLIIEVDGGIHNDQDVRLHDEVRQRSLEAEGISFLRFRNEEIEKEINAVILSIENHIKSHAKPL